MSSHAVPTTAEQFAEVFAAVEVLAGAEAAAEAEVRSWPQTWPSTRLGFAGMGAAAPTTAQTTVVSVRQKTSYVFFASQPAYMTAYATMRALLSAHHDHAPTVAEAVADYGALPLSSPFIDPDQSPTS